MRDFDRLVDEELGATAGEVEDSGNSTYDGVRGNSRSFTAGFGGVAAGKSQRQLNQYP